MSTQWKTPQTKTVRQPKGYAVVPSPSKQPSLRLNTATADEDRDNFDEVADIARRSYKLVKQVMGELNVEHKLLEQFTTAFQPTYGNAGGNTMVLMNSCSQGNTDISRNGDRIKITNFFLAGSVYSSVAPLAGKAYNVRCIVYWQPGPDSITLQFASTASAQDGLLDANYRENVLGITAPKDFDNEAKAEILWDKTFHIPAQGNEGSNRTFRKLIKFQRHTQYENNSSTINNGVLRTMWLSDAPSADANRPVVLYHSRVYFVDN